MSLYSIFGSERDATARNTQAPHTSSVRHPFTTMQRHSTGFGEDDDWFQDSDVFDLQDPLQAAQAEYRNDPNAEFLEIPQYWNAAAWSNFQNGHAEYFSWENAL